MWTLTSSALGGQEGRRAGGECKTRLRLFRKKLHHLLQLPPQAWNHQVALLHGSYLQLRMLLEWNQGKRGPHEEKLSGLPQLPPQTWNHQVVSEFIILLILTPTPSAGCECVCLCIICAPTCEPRRFLAVSMCLCQVGLSGEAWQLLERHLHKYVFANSGHSLPNTKISKVCQLDLNMVEGWAGFSCIISPIQLKNRNLKPQSFTACVM